MTTSSNSLSGELSMSTGAIQCPRCNGNMVHGFIFDRSDGGDRRVINWVEGAPHKAFWTVTSVPEEKCVPGEEDYWDISYFMSDIQKMQDTTKVK